MIPSSLCIDAAQVWCERTRARPARARRSRSMRSPSRRRTASATSRGRSAVRRCSPGTASTPRAASSLQTTGTAIAIDSRILFWVPRAIRSGATDSAAPARCGRISATVPVTVTPGILPSRRIARDGWAPTIFTRVAGRGAPAAGSPGRTPASLRIRVVVHATDETDRVGIVRRVARPSSRHRRRWETSRGASAPRCPPTSPSRRGSRTSSSRTLPPDAPRRVAACDLRGRRPTLPGTA